MGIGSVPVDARLPHRAIQMKTEIEITEGQLLLAMNHSLRTKERLRRAVHRIVQEQVTLASMDEFIETRNVSIRMWISGFLAGISIAILLEIATGIIATLVRWAWL